MRKRTITNFQYFTAFFFLLHSFIPLIGFHKLTILCRQDALFAILLGMVEMLLLAVFLKKIDSYHPNKNIYQKLKDRYPKFCYFLFPFLLLGILLLLCFITQETGTFLHYYLTPEIEPFWILLPLFILFFYLLKKPKEAMFKTTEICFYLYLLVFFLFLIGIVQKANFLKVKPLFSSSVPSIFSASWDVFLSLPLPFFLLLSLPKNAIEKKENLDVTRKKTILFSCFLLFFTLFLILSAIGVYLTNLYKNPLMITYQKISFLHILERVETTLSFSYFLLYFFPLVFLFYHLKVFFIELFPKIKKKETLLLFLLLLFVLLANQFFTFPFSTYLWMNLFFLIFLLFFVLSITFSKE